MSLYLQIILQAVPEQMPLSVHGTGGIGGKAAKQYLINVQSFMPGRLVPTMKGKRYQRP